MKRRTLVKILVASVIGGAVVLESWTFVRLFRRHLTGESEDSEDERRGQKGRVSVGDNLLSETPQVETLEDARVSPEGEKWNFSMSVGIHNDTEEPYSLELGGLTTSSGRVVSGEFTIEVNPGGEATLNAQWQIPGGDLPDSVRATVSIDGSETTYRIKFGSLPVRRE